MCGYCLIVEENVNFCADHPFYFALISRPDGWCNPLHILFNGRFLS